MLLGSAPPPPTHLPTHRPQPPYQQQCELGGREAAEDQRKGGGWRQGRGRASNAPFQIGVQVLRTRQRRKLHEHSSCQLRVISPATTLHGRILSVSPVSFFWSTCRGVGGGGEEGRDVLAVHFWVVLGGGWGWGWRSFKHASLLARNTE